MECMRGSAWIDSMNLDVKIQSRQRMCTMVLRRLGTGDYSVRRTLLNQRLEQRIAQVPVELDVYLRRDLIRKLEQLFARRNRH